MSVREQAEYYREFLLEEFDSWFSMPDAPSTGLILIAQDAGIDPEVLRARADPDEPPTPRSMPRDMREQIEHAALQQVWAYQSLWGGAALTKPNDDILEFYEGKSGINVAFNGVEQHQNLSMDEAWKLAKDFGGYESNQDGRTHIGRAWLSPVGKREVVDEDASRVAIVTDGSPLRQILPVNELEREIRRDEANHASRQRGRASEQSATAQAKRASSWLGFTNNMTPTSRARADKALSKQMGVRGAIASRGQHIIGLVNEGFRVIEGKHGRELRAPNGSFFYEKDLTKTGLDFAEYLSREKRR